MIKRRKAQVPQSGELMNHIVEAAAYAGAAQARGFRLQIENMPQQAGFPVELAISPWVRPHESFELTQHSQRKATIPCDRLMATDRCRHASAIALLKQKQPALLSPEKTGFQSRAQFTLRASAPRENIQARRKP